MERSVPPRNSSGRPRDPQLEARVHGAACRIYGRSGWSGFTIDGVAREAGVGKASIYLRWPDRRALLVDSLVAELVQEKQVDTGSLRGDLTALTRSHVATYLGEHKDAALRMTTEASLTPELREIWQQWRSLQVAVARATVRRGIARGELAADSSVTLILDALLGATLMHALVSPAELLTDNIFDIDDYVAALVDFVLKAAATA